MEVELCDHFMKSVLVSQRVCESNETRDCLDQELVNFIKHCNYLPVPVPNKLFDLLDVLVENTQCAGIVLWVAIILENIYREIVPS